MIRPSGLMWLNINYEVMDPVWTFSKNLPLICSAPHEACLLTGKKKSIPAYLATMPRAGFKQAVAMLERFDII
jgi:hypothetical protein